MVSRVTVGGYCSWCSYGCYACNRWGIFSWCLYDHLTCDRSWILSNSHQRLHVKHELTISIKGHLSLSNIWPLVDSIAIPRVTIVAYCQTTEDCITTLCLFIGEYISISSLYALPFIYSKPIFYYYLLVIICLLYCFCAWCIVFLSAYFGLSPSSHFRPRLWKWFALVRCFFFAIPKHNSQFCRRIH